MTEDTNLTEASEELKWQLAVGECESSVDRILDAAGLILQKLIPVLAFLIANREVIFETVSEPTGRAP